MFLFSILANDSLPDYQACLICFHEAFKRDIWEYDDYYLDIAAGSHRCVSIVVWTISREILFNMLELALFLFLLNESLGGILMGRCSEGALEVC